MVADVLAPVDGMLTVRRPAVDPELVEGVRADDERTAWWLDRIARVEALAGGPV